MEVVNIFSTKSTVHPAVSHWYTTMTADFTLNVSQCIVYVHLAVLDPEKKSLNIIFPIKYVIPKSSKFSHWPSNVGYVGYIWGFLAG